MRARLRTTLATTVAVLTFGSTMLARWPAPAATDQTAAFVSDLVTILDFQRRVDDYVRLHRTLEQSLPPLRPTRNIAEVQQMVAALAMRIRMARPDARQGDIITPDAGRLFRRSIRTCLPPDTWRAILADLDEDMEEPAGPVGLAANTRWPDAVPYSFMPPQLLRVLPPLPPELQYRIIGRSLVLWDHHADLIVDILEGAFAETT